MDPHLVQSVAGPDPGFSPTTRHRQSLPGAPTPPFARLHALVRQAGLWLGRVPQPGPPRGSFPLLGAEPTAPALDPIGCWWPGRWPSTCRPRLPGVPHHQGVLGVTTPGTDPPPSCPQLPTARSNGVQESPKWELK